MSYRERRPPRGFGAGVACVWHRDSPAPTEVAKVVVVPDGCTDVMWERSTGRLWVAGPDTTAHPTRSSAIVGVRFRPGDLAMGLPASELRDARVDVSDLSGLWGARAGEIADRLAQTATVDDAQRVLLSAFPSEPDPVVTAIRELAVRTGSVHDMADQLGLSERQLNRRSHAAFGYGPKMLHRVLRFQRALALAWQGVGFADVAYRVGYADQPHLARDVRALAGVSLSALTNGRRP
ncbi:helix-turn-helix transcriptional regulator [Actinokineospora inagensis]|uniref:helix-turn-helix transcriptional regulator n=1 Tax=Actinokineospora inagensis TaxID=103730 RepID=UPI00047CD00E|nr:helix-turn-helix domain-containing protein [Actinokineospora inagensis]